MKKEEIISTIKTELEEKKFTSISVIDDGDYITFNLKAPNYRKHSNYSPSKAQLSLLCGLENVYLENPKESNSRWSCTSKSAISFVIDKALKYKDVNFNLCLLHW